MSECWIQERRCGIQFCTGVFSCVLPASKRTVHPATLTFGSSRVPDSSMNVYLPLTPHEHVVSDWRLSSTWMTTGPMADRTEQPGGYGRARHAHGPPRSAGGEERPGKKGRRGTCIQIWHTRTCFLLCVCVGWSSRVICSGTGFLS